MNENQNESNPTQELPARPTEEDLVKVTSWHARYRNVPIKLTFYRRWWCYYVYLHEDKCKDFKSLWLEPEVIQTAPGCPEYISYNYGCDNPTDIKMHGGVTYYKKHGEVEDHRCVEVGCDYNHLCDMENGQPDKASVLSDACDTVDWLYDHDYFRA